MGLVVAEAFFLAKRRIRLIVSYLSVIKTCKTEVFFRIIRFQKMTSLDSQISQGRLFLQFCRHMERFAPFPSQPLPKYQLKPDILTEVI